MLHLNVNTLSLKVQAAILLLHTPTVLKLNTKVHMKVVGRKHQLACSVYLARDDTYRVLNSGYVISQYKIHRSHQTVLQTGSKKQYRHAHSTYSVQ